MPGILAANGTPYSAPVSTTISATFTLAKGPFQEPVWGGIITGAVFEIPVERLGRDGENLVFKNIPVYDAPAIITDEATVIK